MRDQRHAGLRGAPARPVPAIGRAAAGRPARRHLDGPRAAGDRARPAGACGLPGHLRTHVPHHRTRRVPGRGRVQRGRRRTAGVRTGRSPHPLGPGRHAFRPAPGPATPARPRRGHPPGPEHRLHRQRRRGAQYPLPPADPGQHGAIRLGQQTAPHPGRRNRHDQRDLGVDRPGQGPDQDAAGRRGRPGADGQLGRQRRGGLAGRAGARRPSQ